MKSTPGTPAIEQRFSLESLVGRGAFGEVYRATDVHTGQLVAVKRLLGDLTDPLIADRFEREARLLARLESPHIVRYIAHGADREGRPCLVLEWLDGEDLAKRQRIQPLAAADAVEAVRQAALGLDALHDAGIVHRDVKPSNFFLLGSRDAPVKLKLIDLGIARAVVETGITLEGSRVGTPLYMSPEQARGEQLISPRSDLFSLGVVLYELLAGRRPFAGEDPFAVLARIMLEEPPRLGALVPNVSPELDALVMRAMSKSPEERFGSAREMAEALAAAPPTTGNTPRGRDEAPTMQLHTGPRVRSLERRVVTAVFAIFAGLVDADAAMEAFAATVKSQGGVCHRTIGRRMIAVFGVSHSSGDEASRAARTALATAAAAPGVRLAVATGRALAGAAGLSGEAIERGAGVVERSRGAVRIDGPTARLIEADFVIEGDEGELVLRGERPATVAMDARLFGRETPTIGRDRELEALEDTVARAMRERRPAVALVLGPPGIGKSRLRFELLRRLAERPPPPPVVLMLRGEPMLADAPLGMLTRALRQEASVPQGGPLDAQRDAVRAYAARLGLSRCTGLIGALLRVDFDAAEEPDLAAAREDPAVMRTRLRETLSVLLHAVADSRPMVLVLEDLQWADTATIDAIGWALDALSSDALVVAAFGRPEAARRFSGLWSLAPVEVPLGPLSARASEQLVRAVLGDDAPGERVESIVTRATGNPLFIEELLRAATGPTEEDAALPLAIQAAFQVRLDALPPDAKRLALVGSVFGSAVWPAALAAMAPEIDVDAALAALVSAEVLAERPRPRFGRTREYVYRHTLLRDAAYEMLMPEELPRLHRLAAAWLSEAGEEDDAVLAHHYVRAGEFVLASERYLAAARRAARESAYEAALELAVRGAALAGAGETCAALHTVAAQASHPLGRYPEGLAHSARALALTRDPARRLELAAIRGLTLRRSGQPAEAHRALTEALAATADASPNADLLRARVAARIELAWSDHAAGNYTAAIAGAGQVLATLPEEVLALEPLVLNAWHVLARAQHGAGDLERAVATHARLVERATRQGYHWRAEGARHGYGQVLLALGRNAEARAVLETAADNARTYRLPSTEGYALHFLGVARARTGDLRGGMRDELRAAEIGARLNAPALEAASRAVYGAIALGAGELAAAAEAAQAALALAGAPETWRRVAAAVRACARVHAGHAGEGVAVAREVAAALEQDGAPGEGDELAVALVLRALVHAGEATAAAGVRDRARTALEARLARVRDAGARAVMAREVPEARAVIEGGDDAGPFVAT